MLGAIWSFSFSLGRRTECFNDTFTGTEYMLKTERNHFLYIIATFKKITYPFFERQQQES